MCPAVRGLIRTPNSVTLKTLPCGTFFHKAVRQKHAHFHSKSATLDKVGEEVPHVTSDSRAPQLAEYGVTPRGIIGLLDIKQHGESVLLGRE